VQQTLPLFMLAQLNEGSLSRSSHIFRRLICWLVARNAVGTSLRSLPAKFNVLSPRDPPELNPNSIPIASDGKDVIALVLQTQLFQAPIQRPDLGRQRGDWLVEKKNTL